MLVLTEAQPGDAARIADFHMAAFGSNQLLLAQFPTPAVREGLRTSLVEKVQAELYARSPVGYPRNLSFIATDPAYGRCGAGSLLMNWALKRAEKETVPVALESTMDAVPFYERLGFRTEAQISMSLGGPGEEFMPYEERFLVFRPNSFPI
ncbi:acyl-CoA N-acyltransferase [Aspergillus ellipticus CBS 707.79]|uniref:Acyl-CoA N-acyltransferase n=1 Tax=Aspergillus ellipticus CBS 707.79 TaxID=1448320 RepID=A0A319DEV6_9EURO|nr:acyl-CoA N-acyltransferase [Aspergillus ellipticus CBS 707.79]